MRCGNPAAFNAGNPDTSRSESLSERTEQGPAKFRNGRACLTESREDAISGSPPPLGGIPKSGQLRQRIG